MCCLNSRKIFADIYKSLNKKKTKLKKIQKINSNFYKNYNPLNLIPIFFDHKIADGVSTVELILTKGQVLDNYDSRLIFVNPCDKLYDNLSEQELFKTLYCPIPPYHSFKKLLEENL